MSARKNVEQPSTSIDRPVLRPKLVKASEFAARREAAAESAQRDTVRVRPAFVRAPRGEDEAREMFMDLFQAA